MRNILLAILLVTSMGLGITGCSAHISGHDASASIL